MHSMMLQMNATNTASGAERKKGGQGEREREEKTRDVDGGKGGRARVGWGEGNNCKQILNCVQ